MRVRFAIASLSCLLAFGAGTDAASAKRATFDMTVSGTQTTAVTATARCSPGGGRLTETLDFSTSRAGRVVFRTGSHGATSVLQERGSGVRPALVRGTVRRQSTLDEGGTTPGDCDNVAPAESCGTHTFDGWKLSLFGDLRLGLHPGGGAGGDPFPLCQNRFDGFPGLVRRRAANVSKKALFGRKRTLRIRGHLQVSRQFDDGFTSASGTAVSTLDFEAGLVRVR